MNQWLGQEEKKTGKVKGALHSETRDRARVERGSINKLPEDGESSFPWMDWILSNASGITLNSLKRVERKNTSSRSSTRGAIWYLLEQGRRFRLGKIRGGTVDGPVLKIRKKEIDFNKSGAIKRRILNLPVDSGKKKHDWIGLAGNLPRTRLNQGVSVLSLAGKSVKKSVLLFAEAGTIGRTIDAG